MQYIRPSLLPAALESIQDLGFCSHHFQVEDVLHRAKIAREHDDMKQMELIVEEIEKIDEEAKRQRNCLAEPERLYL